MRSKEKRRKDKVTPNSKNDTIYNLIPTTTDAWSAAAVA